MQARVEKIGSWDKADRFVGSNVVAAVVLAERMALRVAGEVIKKNIKKGLKSGRRGWKKLHPVTVALKGSSRILWDTGSLHRSVKVVQCGLGVFVGVPAGAGGSKGQDLAEVASVHERGGVTRVTGAVRKRLASGGLYLRGTTKFLVIPQRRFVFPALAESARDMSIAASAALLGGVEKFLGV